MANKKEIEKVLLKYKGIYKQYQEAWDADKYMIENKMLAFIGYNKENEPILTIKMPVEEGAYYRENHECIDAGYYMNKVHWISISYEKCCLTLVEEIIEKAYDNFILLLPKKIQGKLK